MSLSVLEIKGIVGHSSMSYWQASAIFKRIPHRQQLSNLVLFALERVKWYAEESVFVRYGYRTYRVARRLARNFLELLAVEVPTACNALVKLVDF